MIRWTILVILSLIFSCRSSDTGYPTREDSLKQKKFITEIDTLSNRLDSRINLNVLSTQQRLTIISLKSTIDSLKTSLLSGQLVKADLNLVSAKLNLLEKNDFVLLSRIKILSQENLDLKDSNNKVIARLAQQKNQIDFISKQKDSLKSSIDNILPAVVGISAVGYYFHTGILGKTTKAPTSTAEQVERIEIRFNIVPNSMSIKNKWEFEVNLISANPYKSITKRFAWNKNEDPRVFASFDRGEVFKPGTYTVLISIDKSIIHEELLKLK